VLRSFFQTPHLSAHVTFQPAALHFPLHSHDVFGMLKQTLTDNFLLIIYFALSRNNTFFVVILGKSHYMIYSLVTAMKPRMLVTFDKDFNALPVSVRVGQVYAASHYC